MAYQQQGMGNGGPPGPNEHHGPQGAEYTLQGVMRFLQIEWHNHERARNAWDIERAEMKAKIAKQEGEVRHAKKLNEQLERQIRMLEMALKNERAKSRGKATLEEPKDAQKERDSKRDSRMGPNMEPHNSFLDTESPLLNPEDRDKLRDKSRKYLEKCMQEIQYLLTPPPHLPPPQMNPPQPAFNGLPEPPLSLDELYLRQRQQSRGQTGLGQVQQQPSAMLNHQPPQMSQMPNNIQQSESPMEPVSTARETPFSQNLPRPSEPPTEALPQPPASQPAPFDEQVEHVTHTYDSYGRPVANEEPQPAPSQPAKEDHGGWNFDDQPVLHETAPPDAPAPRRPDTDLFPSAINLPAKSPPRAAPGSHGRRRSSGSAGMVRRRSSQGHESHDTAAEQAAKNDPSTFKVKFALHGHLDVVRSVIFTGGGSPSEPEICTAGDDGTIKRWIIPTSYVQHAAGTDLDVSCYFTHRGHEGIVTSLAACPSTSFSTGGRVSGDGWIFSGGQDATVRVWERGRVDPKATLDGHTDAVWSVCVLPGSTGSVFGSQSSNFGGPDRILLASGSADGTVKVWAVSAPPQLASPAGQTGGRRGGGRRHSVTSGSNHPNSPQPNQASNTPFLYTLVHSIERPAQSAASPTCICPLGPTGETFVVSYTDSSVLVFDTRTGEEIIGMASNETYDGTLATSINAVVATSSANLGADGNSFADMADQEEVGAGPTGSAQGIEGVIVSGHEDKYIRFFDANSGQCTYSMLAHPSAISSLSLSKDGREAVSAGHDASIRFWSLDKRICTQDITSHRPMRGEGVCSVVWSQDGRYVVSAGGDGVVKVFAR